MKTAIDRAASDGVRVITHLIGRDTSLNGDDNIAIYREVYTPIGAHAEAKGVRLAFENWPRNGTMLAITPELWDAMFNAVPSPAIGLCYDPSHFYWLGIDYIQPIWDFADRIYHAHAKDTEILVKGRDQFGIYGRQLAATEPAQWWRYRLPGYGHVDWFRYLDTLYQVGYDGVLSVEHEDPVWDATPELAVRGLQLARQFLLPFLV
ncbi:MAG: TIM barrel protein [Caldilineaceae bacterium]|nr:TIM barrel protein [Caldilineaceae bacterium]